MTDQTPFVPPGGPPPPPPPSTSPLYGPPPAVPSLYGPPPQGPPPLGPPPPRRRVKAGVIVAIVAGSVLLVGGLGFGAVALTNLVTDTLRDNAPVFEDATQDDPLVTGEEASPFAVEPMECDACFTDNDIGRTIVTYGELQVLGLTSTIEPWTDYTSTYDAEATFYRKSWRDAGGDPAECFVTYPAAPMGILEEGDVTNDGSMIAYTGTYADDDEWSQLGQSVRIFDEDQEAVDYMAGLPDLIEACSHYRSGSGDTYWQADVTPAPAVSVPDSVAAVGWVESADAYARFYSFDLQRGNIVVRTNLFTYNEISELEFRALIEHAAEQLAAIDPAPSY